MNNWSPQAHRNHKAAASANASYEMAAARMEAGPAIEGDLLTIPSDWYNEQAKDFWKSHGFRWNRETRTWTRGVRCRANGKQYSPTAWLKATRAKFFQFWPGLAPNGDTAPTPRSPAQAIPVTTGPRCQSCDQPFSPINQHQVLCPDCEERHTGNWR